MFYTFDENIVSDIHKDAFGFRPTESFWARWTVACDDGKQSIWDALLLDLAAAVREHNEQERRAIARFETRVLELICQGADDRLCAVRWIHQAEDSDGTDNHLEYLLGLPFGYLKRNR